MNGENRGINVQICIQYRDWRGHVTTIMDEKKLRKLLTEWGYEPCPTRLVGRGTCNRTLIVTTPHLRGPGGASELAGRAAGHGLLTAIESPTPAAADRA